MPKTDSLEIYQSKRHFGNTPEPRFAKASRGRPNKIPRFVIQKHDASHLHYDLRLEHNGVMKSWAVPKGPSPDPSVKRLAVAVEDHPLSYRTFEGIIPAGNYGAGTVEIWDQGSYQSLEGKVGDGLSKGNLKINFQGKKMKGAYALVRMKDGKNWLLIKERDGFANQNYPVSKFEPAAPPLDLTPMLCETAKEPFDRKGWIFEIKWDGYRAIARLSGSVPELFSRNHINLAPQFPEIIESLKSVKHTAVIDGEIVALDKEGRSSFQTLQHLIDRGQLFYYAFDLLYLDGEDLRDLPLSQRKKKLENILPKNPRLRFSDDVKEKGKEFFELALKNGLEGVIAKDATSRYEPGKRSPNWLKLKARNSQEIVIAGFSAPRGERKTLGALIGAVYEGKKLTYVGRIGGIASENDINLLAQKLKPLIMKTSPFDTEIKAETPITWVKPILIAQVAFAQWTTDGQLRQPIFLGLRDDKKATEVIREENKVRVYAHTSQTDERGFTHLDKVFWPEKKYTKDDLISYYQRIGSIILPYLEGRPLSLHRQPSGIDDSGFFEKDITFEVPAFVKTVKIESPSQGKTINWILCENIETLTYLANLGCIELHPWNSRVGALDRPDYVVFDLDPHGVSFSQVIKVARNFKDVFDELGITGVCKTSGFNGLHIFIPLGQKYTTQQTLEFARLISQIVAERLPKIVSLEFNPQKRLHKVYIDIQRNPQGQTTAAAYSLRPSKEASVSTPLTWEEVTDDLDPRVFTLKTIFPRLEKKGDLWRPVLGPGIDLQKVLSSLAR